MGDRVSIQFKKDTELSIVLFSHWDGMSLVDTAKRYVIELKDKNPGKIMKPIHRLEPQTVMVDFVRYLTKELEQVESNYYFGFSETDGDNSDNGHFIISL